MQNRSGMAPFGSGRRKEVGIIARRLSSSTLEVGKLVGKVGQPTLMLFQALLVLLSIASLVDPSTEATER